jgi:hypothetical protein
LLIVTVEETPAPRLVTVINPDPLIATVPLAELVALQLHRAS